MLLMIDQAQQGSTYAEDPVNEPNAEQILLFLIEDTLESRQNSGTSHEYETMMDVQRSKDQ